MKLRKRKHENKKNKNNSSKIKLKKYSADEKKRKEKNDVQNTKINENYSFSGNWLFWKMSIAYEFFHFGLCVSVYFYEPVVLKNS